MYAAGCEQTRWQQRDRRNASLLVAIIHAFHVRTANRCYVSPGTANSRNTCVDMRLTCVACRPLDVIRVLCSSVAPPPHFPSSPGISLTPVPARACFLAPACAPTLETSVLPAASPFTSYNGRAFLEHAEVDFSLALSLSLSSFFSLPSLFFYLIEISIHTDFS